MDWFGVVSVLSANTENCVRTVAVYNRRTIREEQPGDLHSVYQPLIPEG